MKKFLLLFFLILLSGHKIFSQIIPYGISSDTFKVVIYNTDSFANSMTYNYYPLGDTIQARMKVYYYKPLNYDSTQSPFLIGIHGQNGTGIGFINAIQTIADSRGALIIAPVMPGNGEGIFWEIWGNYNWVFGWATKTRPFNCIHGYHTSNWGFWWPPVIKQIYRHALIRENRNFVSTYLTGFSMGGQFTTRYMLIRQAMPDSIPIINAVSVSPYFYTFGTDTLNGVPMYFPCGLLRDYPIYCNGCAGVDDPLCCPYYGDTVYSLIPNMCNEHVIQYYNENYAVLIGTADTTGATSTGPCMQAQGSNRYERAQNFYAFSDSNAVARGTTLQWQYGEVPGVAHDQNLMYNTILAGDSMPLAERLLFETPYHTVPNLAPLANFTADTTIVNLPSATVQFYNGSINTTNYLWDFGDSTTSTLLNPSHTYAYADTFTVTLTAISGSGCEDELVKQNYIIVTLSTGVESYTDDNSFGVYPNPANETFNINYSLPSTIETGMINVYDMFGRKNQAVLIYQKEKSLIINTSSLPAGIYFITLVINGEVKGKEKVFIIK